MAWPTKQGLREIGRLALERSADPPPRIDEVRGAGIIAGARLRVSDGSTTRTVAVRTSLVREVGFARRPDGRWVTIPKVDEVVVAAPSADEPDAVEVLSFDSHTLIEVFDAALAIRKEEDPKLSRTAPIFVTLDGAASDGIVGLKVKAKWQMTIRRSDVSARRDANRSLAEGFIDRVKREFAEMNGVDVSKVVIEFKITT
jgi:hypothetical protein